MFGSKPEGKLCHHTGHKSPCVKDRCPKWISIQGTHPQTGAPVNQTDCSDVWVPLLLVDVSRKLNALEVSTHAMNNELSKSNAASASAISSLASGIRGALSRSPRKELEVS